MSPVAGRAGRGPTPGTGDGVPGGGSGPPPELVLDPDSEIRRLEAWIRSTLRALRRRGVVVGVSGGVDSAVCAALAARAVGPGRVDALLMPERDSDPEGSERARDLCRRLGISRTRIDLTPVLESVGCYESRDEAVRELFPDFDRDHRMKISVAGGPESGEALNTFDLTVESPDGDTRTRPMPASVYREVVAATNMKQRARKMMEYRRAEGRNFAVLGTPNRLEYDLGFFVRGGDGLADLKPIAHLYKTQVYALAAALDVPEAIRAATPSTDTFSLSQSQEEFYFALPYRRMDRCLKAWHQSQPAEEAADRIGLTPDAVRRVYRDIESKRRTAERGLSPAPVPPSGSRSGGRSAP